MFSRLSLTCLALIIAGSAQAATYTYDFVAESGVELRNDEANDSIVDDISALADLNGTPQAISGTITFDDTLLGINGSTGIYAPAVFIVNGLDTSGVQLGDETWVTNAGTDGLATVTYPTSTSPIDAIDIIFRDSTGTAFSSNTPFPALIDLADFDLTTILFYNPQQDPGGGTDFSTDRADFTVTSLTLRQMPAVPLPAGLPLLVGGLGLLAIMRRRRR